jgi:hypothetical protein
LTQNQVLNTIQTRHQCQELEKKIDADLAMAALSSEQEAKSRVPPDQAFRNMLFTEDNV